MSRDGQALRATSRLAERVWRWPLMVAALLMVAAGPAQAAGLTGLVEWAALVAVGLAAVAVPVGLLALTSEGPSS